MLSTSVPFPHMCPKFAFVNSPKKKYEDTSGIAAFVGLCNQFFKSAAYLTEAFTGVQLPLAPPGSAAAVPPVCDEAYHSEYLRYRG
ncbi:hypothetical protein EDB19DRAFT_574590 [Suillus lakei]|nr:hypothetical protein EDB19DRAFT_574590 [Suillus lakei]